MTAADPVQADNGTPAELVPKIGHIAKDRTTYESVFLTKVPQHDKLQPLTGQIDLTESPALYQEPAEGVIITTEQEWLPKGLGLGRLLHSLSLAPGESTRVAVIDWSRQVAAQTTSETAQTEELREAALRHRGVSELTEALAREEQHGSSVATSSTSSSSRSGSAGISFFGFGGGGSSSRSSSRGMATNVSRSSGSRNLSAKTSQRIQDRTQQLATSSRDLRATAVQETSEAEAAAASTRVVTNYNHMHALTMEYWEVIQEYELRTRTKRCERCVFIPMKVVTFDDSVFKRYAPVLIDAAPPTWAEKLAAVDPFATSVYRTRASDGSSSGWNQSGRHDQTVPMGPQPPKLLHLDPTPGPIKVQVPDPELPDTKDRVFAYFGMTNDPDRPGAVGWNEETGTWVRLGCCTLSRAASRQAWRISKQAGKVLRAYSHKGEKAQDDARMLTDTVFRNPDTGVVYRVCDQGLLRGRPVMRRELDWSPASEIPVQSGAEKLTVSWDDGGILSAGLTLHDDGRSCQLGDQPPGGKSDQIEFGSDERLREIVFTSEVTRWGRELRRIAITTDQQGPIEFGPDIAEGVETRDEHIRVRDAVLCDVFGTVDPTSRHLVSMGFRLLGPHVSQETLDHLNDNELHYSRAIWANADELALTRILANYEYDDDRGDGPLALSARLDPNPVAMTGNYLGFRWHFPDEEKRAAWMEHEGLEEADPDDKCSWTTTSVSLPTEGVFGEAVLGRSVGAERLDITKFWDWQTSPIPILPSEIAPIDTGSRAREVAAATEQLARPAVQLHTFGPLPDPSGTAASLRAVATGNLFRDMSGLEATSQLLQKGIEVAAESEGKSAEQATIAMQEANRHMEKMSQMAVDAAKEVAPMLLGPGGAAASVAGNSSKLGALLNLASSRTGDGNGDGRSSRRTKRPAQRT